MRRSDRVQTNRFVEELNWLFSDSLLGPLRSIGSATVAAAGPWIVAVLALGVISFTMEPMLGIEAVEDMRLTVVYAFCLAPLAANPVGVVASRRIATCVGSGTPDLIPGVYLVACAASGFISLSAALILALAIGLQPLGIGVGFVFLTTAAALLWTSFAVLGALRDMRFLIRAFSMGMLISVLCILYFAKYSPTTELLIWCFIAGCLFCVALTATRVLGVGKLGCCAAYPAFGIVMKDLRANLHLAVGVLLATVAVWADKWLFWFSGDGVRSDAGFLHYPLYDSVMFLAHLSIIPSMAAMIIAHEGDFTRSIQRFRSNLGESACLADVVAAEHSFISMAWSRMTGIVFIQGTVSAACVLIAPFLTDLQKFSFDQFINYRVGVVAIFLYTIFHLAAAMLIICNQVRTYALLQGGFLVINIGLSSVFYVFQGTTAYPFFLSSLAMAMIAIFAAYHAMGRLGYLTMLGANDSLLR